LRPKRKENLLLVFTKNPVAGKVKTRLAKDIGDLKALEIYKFLLEHSAQFTATVNASKQVYYSDSVNMDDIWDNKLYSKRKQEGEDLGKRMLNAFENGFREGFESVIVIGSDMYDIDTIDIEYAFQELENHDYVIGPASDGGYYLLGMKALNSKVFRNKVWGTSSVLKDTMEDLRDADVKLLETRNDVDLLEDIESHPAFQNFLNV